MRNKLIISSLICFFCFAAGAQNREDESLRVSIYPNPTVEALYVELSNDHQDVAFELTSMIGTKLYVRPEDIGYGKYKIPVKDLASGYYFLVVTSSEEKFRHAMKFLKN